MNHIAADQQDVHRLEGIAFALDVVLGPALNVEYQLVKFVVVVVQLYGPAVPEMEQPVVLMQISPFADFAPV